MAIFNTNKTTATCKDSFSKISMIGVALSIAGLSSMLDVYLSRILSDILIKENLMEQRLIRSLEKLRI